MIPAGVLFAGILLIPASRGIVYSFSGWDGVSSVFRFIRIDNFVALFRDTTALGALGHTLLLTLATTVGENVLGLHRRPVRRRSRG